MGCGSSISGAAGVRCHCGWPSSIRPRQITGVSNSQGQREWIEAERDRRGLNNLEVITADVNEFEPNGRFDRVMSIEMFEHMRNWRELLRRIAGWLEPDTRQGVRPRVQPPHPALPVRGHVGGGALLHRRAHAQPRAAGPLPERPGPHRRVDRSRDPLRPHVAGVAGAPGCRRRGRPRGAPRRRVAPSARLAGCWPRGGCSSSPPT